VVRKRTAKAQSSQYRSFEFTLDNRLLMLSALGLRGERFWNDHPPRRQSVAFFPIADSDRRSLLPCIRVGENPPLRRQPFADSVYHGGPQHVPGRVMCAYYDVGGEGVAYHDSDAKNHGSGTLNPADGTYLNQFRMNEGVDTSDAKFHDQIDNHPYNLVLPPENLFYVGWVEPGENGST
jgi:hypothetical protein